jgi:hypothetical protein
MGGLCDTPGRNKNTYSVLIGNRQGKTSLGPAWAKYVGFLVNKAEITQGFLRELPFSFVILNKLVLKIHSTVIRGIGRINRKERATNKHASASSLQHNPQRPIKLATPIGMQPKSQHFFITKCVQ